MDEDYVMLHKRCHHLANKHPVKINGISSGKRQITSGLAQWR